MSGWPTPARPSTGIGGGGGGEYDAASELLRALSSPIRIAIVVELGAGSRRVHELVDAVGVTQPLISQHLRVLRGAGLVRGERRGREIAYTLTDDHVARIVADAVTHSEGKHERDRGRAGARVR